MSSLTLILIFWWIELVILRNYRKAYQKSIFDFGDIWKIKFVFYQTLNAFLHTGKPVSPRMLVWQRLHTVTDFICYTSWLIVQTIGLPVKKEASDIKVFVNIYIIKQSMLLTFLWLLRIVQVMESTKRGTTEFIQKFFRGLTMGWAFSLILRKL